MKKTYEKPRIAAESFELSQHIAACDDPLKNKTNLIKEGCNGDFLVSGYQNVFFMTILDTQCTIDGEDMYCYTNAVPTGKFFSS